MPVLHSLAISAQEQSKMNKLLNSHYSFRSRDPGLALPGAAYAQSPTGDDSPVFRQ
jgi:hypothetical protein